MFGKTHIVNCDRESGVLPDSFSGYNIVAGFMISATGI